MSRWCCIGMLLILAAPAAAQDMPLSQVLIDGEGWKRVDPSHPESSLVRRMAGRERVVTGKGTAYVIVPVEQAVYHIDGTRKRKVAERLGTPAGITLTPDQGTLYVGDAGSKYLWAFRVEPDGSLAHGERYASLRARAGQSVSRVAGLTVDTVGRIYATSAEGVQIFDPTGRLSGVLLPPGPGPLTGLRFGGPERNTLLVVCGTEVWARKTQAQGLPEAGR